VAAAGKASYLQDEITTYRKPEGYDLVEGHEEDCFFLINKNENVDHTNEQLKVINYLSDGAHSLFFLAEKSETDAEALGLTELVNRGEIGRIALTPTDILHASGKFVRWDREISEHVVKLLADTSQRSYEEFLDEAVERVHKTIFSVILHSVFNIQKQNIKFAENSETSNYLAERVFSTDDSLMKIDFKLNKPIIAIGAPVETWLKPMEDILHTKVIVPEHYEVANAVGAAIGNVIERVELTIRYDKLISKYVVFSPVDRAVFTVLDEAISYGKKTAEDFVRNRATLSGSSDFEIKTDITDTFTEGFSGDTKEKYVETKIVSTASGTPLGIKDGN